MTKIKHLGIIMDGNRRWAKKRGLPPMAGHQKGYDKMKQVGDWCLARGIDFLTVYAFSTENWQRSKKEVDYLMKLLERGLTKELPQFMKKNIRLKIIGSRDKLSVSLKRAIKTAEDKTKNNTAGTLNIAVNYGGRLEVVEAVKKIVRRKIPINQISEQTISDYVWTAGEPDPDLIIRTSGEYRLSGFLTWQGVYSELYFTKKFWPDFSERDLDEAILEFNR
ncbi:MAG TPA: polyprenyl diphosphate synthase, partial [bacterium]|nr:polyprenyl diphosphate synthase [bacterium]